MPVVLRKRGYRFMFFASDAEEPPHIHVKRDRSHAKYWISPAIILEKTRGFRPHELNEVEDLIDDHHEYLLEAWDAFFGS
jgi:hypothetical protein